MVNVVKNECNSLEDFKLMALDINIGSWAWYCKLESLGVKELSYSHEITKALSPNEDGYMTDVEFTNAYNLYLKYKVL